MSQEHVKQAVIEALGSEKFPKHVQDQVNKQAQGQKVGNLLPGQDAETERYISAIREVMGSGSFNPNVEQQVRSRVRTLAKGGNHPAPGTSPAVPSHVAEQEKSTQPPAQGNNDPNAQVDAQGHATRSLKEGVEGDVNAQQKAAFEKNPQAATHGGTNPGVGVTTSDVAAATNSGNRAAGPGAGTMNSTTGAAPTTNPN
jgi:hypothetical protein